MISFKNILTIAQYEAKVLWRNWFFRIIALAGIFFVTILNIVAFSEVNTSRWFMLSNSWMMPYATMMLISVTQVAAVIFLATGLIKKDKKLDTNDVFFVRPITNLDYVLGKAFALFKLFFLLNLVLLCIPVIVNLTSPLTEFNPLAFVIYPLITSVPSIVFATGIAFLVVTLIKNQPVTIVLLLGLGGVEIIYYFDKLSNILDFMAFRLPMFISDMVGFVDMGPALWQRSFYFFTGLGFLFMTAFFLDRLPSHKIAKWTTGIVGVSLLALSSFIMIKLWDFRNDPIELRKEMITVNGKWAEQPNIDIVSNTIDLELLDGALFCTSEMIAKNNTNQTITEAYFTLNPDLTVDEIMVQGQVIETKRDLQIISTGQSLNIRPGQEIKIQVRYHGTINEAIAHLEVDQERYETAVDYFMHSLQKKHAFLQSDYALLTKDIYWYPDTQVGYSRELPNKERFAFIDFQLNVKTNDGLIPVSQGEPVINGNIYQFKPEYALPQISLAIGNYVKKEITVDSVTYSVFHYPKNDYFTKQLDQIADTLSYLITDIAAEYEDGQKLAYPFRRLQFVETPLQFTAYNKVYENHQAFAQPETIYWPEEGGDIRQFDFRRQLKDMDRQSREENQVLGDKEKQANVFNDLVKKVFTKQIGSGWFFDGRNEDDPDFSLFPNLYAYNSGIVSNDWPLLNVSIAAYLRNDKQPQADYSRNLNGISFAEECNNLMRESSITEILTEETDFSKIHKSVSMKGQYLFSYLGQLVGEEVFKAFLYEWINSHQHKLTSFEDFNLAILTRFDIDLESIIKQVYYETSQPAFEIVDLQKYEVLDGDRKRYQVLLQVKNTGENNGVLEVKFDTGDNSDNLNFTGRRVNEEVEEEVLGQLSIIKQGETKLIGYVLDEKPNEITINTNISRNIPSVISMSLGTLAKREGGTLFEGERIADAQAETKQYEVVVDNEDLGFTTFSPIEPTYLRAYLDSRNTSDKKYYGSWFRSYSKWLATTGSEFYGSSIRSAHFTRAGSGEKTTTWTPELQDEGFYDIYVFMRGKNQNQFQGNDDNNRQYNYRYIINHGDGMDNINYNLSNAEPGWNYLGSYYFNKTGGNIMLTDECEMRTVYADAIKWVKQ